MISFILLSVIILALAAISCLGGDERLYTSVPMIVLWGALAVSAIVYIFRQHLYRRWRVFALHLSFIVILAGGVVTHFAGTSQTLHLRVGESAQVGPLEVTLRDFAIDYYPGTMAPADFVSSLTIDGRDCTVSMNNVADVRGYRFFQTSYDPGLTGSTLTVTHDPAGTGVTYAGYAMLFVSMLLCLLPRRRVRKAALPLVLCAISGVASAAPRTIPAEVASRMGDLAVYHNGRIAPLSTMAADITRKLTGSASWHGLTPEQFVAGWLFFYDDWKDEPCILVKDAATRRELGVEKYASLSSFFGPDGYRFDDACHAEANEKFSIASSVAAGSVWRIFPWRPEGGAMAWYSPVDNMPSEMPVDDWHIARHSLNYVAGLVEASDWAGVNDAVDKIARWQRKHAADVLPSRTEVACERWYMGAASTPVLPGVVMVCGVLLLIFRFPKTGYALCVATSLFVLSVVVANWIASGHLPLSNGHETMQLMALCSLLVSLWLGRRHPSFVPLGLVVAGLALLVAWLGQRSPQVTQLMPVLNSPLLSLHVLTVMLAYSLLALMALSGVMWLCGRRDMLSVARRMLKPAVFLLAAGIFIGAVWANTSWGRYWGWDPKEVWALITMLVYSYPLHASSIRCLRSDRAFAIFCMVAFVTVLMTYFGVNYILGGMHSYS